MRIVAPSAIHLSYCTNIHPGETWGETFSNIRQYVLAVREKIAPGKEFGIGLRLSDLASRELAAGGAMREFQDFLAAHQLYVFTINGFPYGQFHGTKIKEEVFAPDWTRPERLTYTKRLADLLARLLPEGMEGGISTLPGSFEEWIRSEEQVTEMVWNLAECALHLNKIFLRTGKIIHLGLEPEPMGYIETTDETVDFFTGVLFESGARHLESRHGIDEYDARAILKNHLGVCYDTCHMAVEYENAAESLEKYERAGIRISKVQISSALKLAPSAESLKELERFADGVYLHQVIARTSDGTLRRWKDIAPALSNRDELLAAKELRVHCHVPLYMTENRGLGSTSDHILDFLAAPWVKNKIAHFEIETYTWDVLPTELRRENVADAVADEFEWFLAKLESHVPQTSAARV